MSVPISPVSLIFTLIAKATWILLQGDHVSSSRPHLVALLRIACFSLSLQDMHKRYLRCWHSRATPRVSQIYEDLFAKAWYSCDQLAIEPVKDPLMPPRAVPHTFEWLMMVTGREWLSEKSFACWRDFSFCAAKQSLRENVLNPCDYLTTPCTMKQIRVVDENQDWCVFGFAYHEIVSNVQEWSS